MIPERYVLGALVAAVSTVAAAPPALAAEVRPSGYLERGSLEWTEAGPRFVPDAESGQRFGRYFRMGGYDNLVTYGLGGHPALDWLWPSYRLTPTVKDLIAVSPGGLDRMVRYEEAQSYAEGFARIGMLMLVGSLLTAGGGLGYNLLPGNLREMQPGFWYATGGVAALGLLTYGSASWSAHDNQAILDQAIAAYNRDMAGRRRLGAPKSVPLQ